MMSGQPLASQLDGAGLTTAEIYYFRPDAPSLLQLFVWQDYDRVPDFPRLLAFLDYWRCHIEAALQSVRVVHHQLIGPAEWQAVNGVISIP